MVRLARFLSKLPKCRLVNLHFVLVLLAFVIPQNGHAQSLEKLCETEWHFVEYSEFSQVRGLFQFESPTPIGDGSGSVKLLLFERELGTANKSYFVGQYEIENSDITCHFHRQFHASEPDLSNWEETEELVDVTFKIDGGSLNIHRLKIRLNRIQSADNSDRLLWWKKRQKFTYVTLPISTDWILDGGVPPGFQWKNRLAKYKDVERPFAVLRAHSFDELRSEIRHVASYAGVPHEWETMADGIVNFANLVDRRRPLGGYALLTNRFVDWPDVVVVLPTKSAEATRTWLTESKSRKTEVDGIEKFHLVDGTELFCKTRSGYLHVSNRLEALLADVGTAGALLELIPSKSDLSLDIYLRNAPEFYLPFFMDWLNEAATHLLDRSSNFEFMFHDFGQRTAIEEFRKIVSRIEDIQLRFEVASADKLLELIVNVSENPNAAISRDRKQAKMRLGFLPEDSIISMLVPMERETKNQDKAFDTTDIDKAINELKEWGIQHSLFPKQLEPLIRKEIAVLETLGMPSEFGFCILGSTNSFEEQIWVAGTVWPGFQRLERLYREETKNFNRKSNDGFILDVERYRNVNIHKVTVGEFDLYIGIGDELALMTLGETEPAVLKDSIDGFHDNLHTKQFSPIHLTYNPIIDLLNAEQDYLEKLRDTKDRRALSAQEWGIEVQATRRINRLELEFPQVQISDFGIEIEFFGDDSNSTCRICGDLQILKAFSILGKSN